MPEGVDAKQAIRMLADRLLVQVPGVEGERSSRDVHALAAARIDGSTGLYL